MYLDPTKGWRGIRNARPKPTNRRRKVGAEQAEEKRRYLEGRAKRHAEIRRTRATLTTLDRTGPAGVASTLFKIRPWNPGVAKMEKIALRHIHPRHKRPSQAGGK